MATGCRERACPWKGNPTCCLWHSDHAARDDDQAWDSANGYARYRGARDDRRT